MSGYTTFDPTGTTDVTSSAAITDNTIVRGDGGGQGIQDSGITIDDSDNITGVTSQSFDGSTSGTIVVQATAIAGTNTLTLPAATDTLVGKATTDVLTNKTLTSPVINTGVTGTAVLDDDTMATASATTIATSESIKAYVDAQAANAELTIFDASVGATGADYTTISGALAASKNRLLVLDDVTETSDCAIPAAGLFIYILKGKTLAMGTFGFTCAAARRPTIIGQDQSSGLSYGYGSEKYLVAGSTFANHVIFDTLTITNTSSVADCYLVDGSSGNDGTERYSNLKIVLPNAADGGIHFWSDNGIAENIHLVGGGTTCSEGMSNSGGNQQVSNIRLSGTFVASASGAAAILTGGTLNGLFIDHAGDTAITLAGGLSGGGIYLNGNGTMTTTVLTLNDNVQLSNVNLIGPGSGTRTIDINGSDVALSNFYTDTLTQDTARADAKLTNGQVVAAYTANGDRWAYTNVDFIGGATVPTGQDNNGFFNCQFGADAGGGALTLTIDAGSNNTRVVGCMSDAAISDAGTGSVLTANVVY